MKLNDRVWITCDGRRVEGRIILISPNKVSIMLSFEAMLCGHVGLMPVLRHEDGVYRTITGDMQEVGIELYETVH